MSNQEVIKMFQENLIVSEKSKDTAEDYGRWLIKFFEFINKNFDKLTMFDIQKFVNYKLQSGCVASTVKQFISCINSFYSYCNDFDIHTNKIKYKQLPDKGRQDRVDKRDYVSPAQFDEFFDSNEEVFRNNPHLTNVRKWVILYLLCLGGIRKTEIGDILESDVEFLPDEKIYHIHISNGKGGRPREVYLHESFKEPYELYLELKKKENLTCENLLCTWRNKPLYNTALNNVVDDLTKNAGFDLDISPHRLRDLAADHLLSIGYDIGTVSQMLGHKNVNTTAKHYLRGHDDMQRQAAAGSRQR
jgi:site-specific recombinase XerD